MNINDLQPGSYSVDQQGTGAPLNIKNLQPGSYSVTPPPAAPNLLQKLGGTFNDTVGAIGNRVQQGAQALNDSASGKIEAPEAGLRIFGSVVGAGNDIVSGAVKGGLQTANAATGGALGNAARGGLQAIAQTPLGAMGVSALQGGADKWQAFADKYPRAAQDFQAIPEAAQMILNFVGAGAAAKTAEVAAPLVKTAATTAADVAKTGVTNAATKLTERSTANALQKTVDAVTPELKGKGLTQAYKDIVTGTRDVKPGGIIKPQAVAASERETGVGKRLFQEVKVNDESVLPGIRLQNKPVKDIVTLRDALKTTETKLEDTLKGDPSLVYNADKPTLINTLTDISTKMPEEFKAIKDSGAVFQRVVNYGKRVVAKTEDTVTGLRDARTAFDAQAKIEFPSAFKDGAIDLKTPAGRAIKSVRDAINDHLYETAPEGSAIKELIGREADIYRARDAIAPRAAAGEGKSLLQQGYNAAKEHKAITAFTTYEAAKHTFAPQLPGL